MLPSKRAVIYSSFLLIIVINLFFEANSSSSESKVHFSRAPPTTNQGNNTNHSHKMFSDSESVYANLNTSSHSLSDTHSSINQTDLQAETVFLKRLRRRISMKSNACSHRNGHQDAHKLVDRCARKKTSRRNPKLHVHDYNDTSKKQNDIEEKKQGLKSSALLNGKKVKKITNTAQLKDFVKKSGKSASSYMKKKRITVAKFHEVNKTNPNNLSKNYNLNDKSGFQDKSSRPYVDKVLSTVKGVKRYPVHEIASIKHLHESSVNQMSDKNKKITDMRSSVKRISNKLKQKKEKGHKTFENASNKLNTPMSETEYTLKNDDSARQNQDIDHENPGKITGKEMYTSHSTSGPKENGLDGRNNLTESAKLEKVSIPFHDQESKDIKIDSFKVTNKSEEKDRKKELGNEAITENSRKKLKVRTKAGYLKKSRATLHQVKAHNALSRIRKHFHSKSLKRNTRNEKDILHEVKDFIVHHFPKKRDEHEVKSSQAHKNVHRETRNTNDGKYESASRKSGRDTTDFKSKNKNSEILEEIKDFVVKNFHLERKKRNSLDQQNLVPVARSFRSSNDYDADLFHVAVRSKNDVPGKIRPSSFRNAGESDNFWGDLQGVVKREFETTSISEAIENFTVNEYDDADDTNTTEFSTDAQPQIIKKGVNVNDSIFGTTRHSDGGNDDFVSDRYNEDSPELATNEVPTTETENVGTSNGFASTEVASDEVSETEAKADDRNDNNYKDNVSENPDSSSLPNNEETPKVTSKHLIEREISTSDHPSVSSEEATNNLSNTFSEISDVTTTTSSPTTSAFSKSDSTTYENTTPSSTESSPTESKDTTSVANNTDWNSESSLPSSTYTEGQEHSVETSSVLLSTYSTTEESSSVTGTDKVQTSTRAPKVYRDIHHVKEEEEDYDDLTANDKSTSDTFEVNQYTSTVKDGLSRIKNTSILEGYNNKMKHNDKDYKYKLFTMTETTSKSIKKFDNAKIPSNSIRKQGGKSQTKHQNNHDSERMQGNMSKYTPKYQLFSVKDQKEEHLPNTEGENEYDEGTVSEETSQGLTATTELSKVFGSTKEGLAHLRAPQQKKSKTLGNTPQKLVNSDVHSQYDYDDEDISQSTIQDLTSTSQRRKAFVNTKGKRVNSNIILKGNYKSLGIEFHTLANSSPNTLFDTEEGSSTAENRMHISGSSKPTVQDKKGKHLEAIENSDEDEYEFQTESTLEVSTATSVPKKVFRKPKEKKASFKRTHDVRESMDETSDYPPKLIVLQLRNETVKAEAIPTVSYPVSKTSRTSLLEKEIKDDRKNIPDTDYDEYEYSSDITSATATTETVETTTKSSIPKHKHLKKGEKLSNHGFESYSKSSKLKTTPLSEMQRLDDEMASRTIKPLKDIEGDLEENESDKFASEVMSGHKLGGNSIRKQTMSPNEKAKASSKYVGQALHLKNREYDERGETESTRKEVERDQTFATYFVTLQNAKIMPDDTTTSSPLSTYSDNPRAHESLSRLESLNDLGEEYYDEVAHNSQNGERTSKHVLADNEMKSSGDKVQVENETVGQGNFDDRMNDVEKSSYGRETFDYSTVSDDLETSTIEETTANDYEQDVSATKLATENLELSQQKSVIKPAGKDKEFVRHLSSLISHLKQRRRKSQLEALNRRIIRKARAVATFKPTAEPKLDQVRIPPAKEWWIGGAGIIIMSLLIIGMYHTVRNITKKERVRKTLMEENDFHAVLHHYDTDNEMEDRLSDDVILLKNLIDQVIQKHEISEDGSMMEEYSTAEHLSRIHAASTGTID